MTVLVDFLTGDLILLRVAGVRREGLIGLNLDLVLVFLTTVRLLGVRLMRVCRTRGLAGRLFLMGVILRLEDLLLAGVTRVFDFLTVIRELGLTRVLVFVTLVRLLGLLTDFLA